MLFRKGAVLLILVCCAVAAAAGGGETAAEAVAGSGKPFTMVVGDSVIVIEKYRLIPSGGEEKDAPAAPEPESHGDKVKVKSFLGILGSYASAVGGWFAARRGEFGFFGLGLALTLVATLVLNRIVRALISRFFKSGGGTKGKAESVIGAVYWPLTLAFAAVGVRLSFESFNFISGFGLILMRTAVAASLLAFFWAVCRAIDAIGRSSAAKRGSNAKMDELLSSLWRRSAKLAVWVIAILFIFQNVYGLNINTLLASAGVAGLAIAFAAQNTLANFFGSVMIIVDRPFTVGDRIKVADTDGIVEGVGFRSTRIRALDGSLFILPNSRIADATVENVSRRPNIKYAFDISLTYSTTKEQMCEAMAILHDILDNCRLFNMKEQPPRINFTELRDWSLCISVVVWFQTPDFFEMQAEKSRLNLEILERFNAAGLSFAFPSNTTYLDGASVDAIRSLSTNNKMNSTCGGDSSLIG